MWLRHLPPSAAPVHFNELMAAFSPPDRNQTARQSFETALRQYFSVDLAWVLESGRTALRIILEVVRNNPALSGRQQVILPAYTCPVLVGVVRDAGLQPVLCDIDPVSMDYDLIGLERLVTEQTLAVIHVHPFGYSLPSTLISGIAERMGIVVVEDACQSMGASMNGHLLGEKAALTFASFGPGKPLSLGGGGVMFVNDPIWRQAAENWLLEKDSFLPADGKYPGKNLTSLARLFLSNQAYRPPAWWAATRLGIQKVGDDTRYWGYQLERLTEAQSKIGRLILPRLENLNRERQRIASALYQGLVEKPGISLFTVSEGSIPIYLRFPILVREAENREAIYSRLWKAGIGVGKMYGKTLVEIFPELGKGSYPGAETFARQLLTLPTHQYVREADVDRMLEIIREA